MSMDVNEKDWKLFRKNLLDWQENYMEKLIKEYIEFLSGDGLASDKFWELEKKIKSVDKLIAMMKQRTDNSATYKEYQERSALTQKHFRKKNATAIDRYEEADRYINEHIKAYYNDGKAPKRSELQARSLELKEKYNALVPEHNAFLRKQAAASQYTRQVRRYLEAKEQQERNRPYQERKRSQQKKKDYLE